jgi:hypothetical protein
MMLFRKIQLRLLNLQISKIMYRKKLPKLSQNLSRLKRKRKSKVMMLMLMLLKNQRLK